MEREPRTLQEAIIFFSDEDRALAFMVNYRWPDELVRCPTCDRDDPRFLANQRRWECRNKHPRKQFSIKVGTIFEDSPIGLDKWLPALWMLANDKNGISSYELARALGVTQKTAWFMLSRIRLAMHDDDVTPFDGEVEVDETYVGGKAKNMHKRDKERKLGYANPNGTAGKTVVMGVLERGGRVRAGVVSGTQNAVLDPIVREFVEKGARVYTDAHSA